MNKEFIPYEQALDMKLIGFDEPCFGAYGAWGFMSSNDVNSLSDNVTQEDLDNQAYLEEDGVCLAPTYSQCFRWFREKYQLYCHIEHIGASNQYQWHIKHHWLTFETYEEAELSCLKRLIEIVKQKS